MLLTILVFNFRLQVIDSWKEQFSNAQQHLVLARFEGIFFLV